MVLLLLAYLLVPYLHSSMLRLRWLLLLWRTLGKLSNLWLWRMVLRAGSVDLSKCLEALGSEIGPLHEDKVVGLL